ncbi:hypothetical protein BDK51DRAFT_30656 [Blyttiomyces helicus]|uniref:NmrA-like domain-containing protein n=1 Tax=Blyttiomyces helicus TaxID=388810 RepID=A0A4P9WGE2_9FUNG|nr:hypothetical protein BDK51DRAFT_30656 [Blyttiomyces helicus]|eukprot:RKO91881.1 hypothetical protein BDK51DRAFT_30656 [Blyttiomyces helicus]
MATSTPLDTLLLVGGSGRLCKLIATQALGNPFFKKVTILSRGAMPDEEKEWQEKKRATLAELAALGATVVELDYTNVDDASLVEVFKGHKAAVLITGTSPDGDAGWQQSARMVDIAKAAGVQRLIPNVFGMDYNLNTEYSYLWPRRLVREHIVASGLEYTEFMVGLFDDYFFDTNLLMTDFDAWKATLFEPEHVVAFTAREDVAKYVVATLEHRASETRNRSLRVTSALVSIAEMVRRAERALPSRGPFDITRVAAERVYDYTTPDSDAPKDGVKINQFLRMAARGTAGWAAELSDNGMFEGIVEVRDVWATLDEKVRQWKENNAGAAVASSEE